MRRRLIAPGDSMSSDSHGRPPIAGVMSDGWTNGKGRSIINFLVNCPRGTIFIKSVDASPYVKDAHLLCDLLDKFIQEIGPQYVVQVITDNAAIMLLLGGCLWRGMQACIGLLVLPIALI